MPVNLLNHLTNWGGLEGEREADILDGAGPVGQQLLRDG
jgi:hypothetical protein